MKGRFQAHTLLCGLSPPPPQECIGDTGTGSLHGGDASSLLDATPPPSRSGPKAPRGGGGGILGGGSGRGDGGGAVGRGGVQVGRFGVVGWGAGGGGHHCSPFWTPTLTLTRASGES